MTKDQLSNRFLLHQQEKTMCINRSIYNYIYVSEVNTPPKYFSLYQCETATELNGLQLLLQINITIWLLRQWWYLTMKWFQAYKWNKSIVITTKYIFEYVSQFHFITMSFYETSKTYWGIKTAREIWWYYITCSLFIFSSSDHPTCILWSR